jgi:hypothetical protein
MKNRFRSGLAAAAALLVAGGCGDDKMTTPTGEGTVIIELEHEVAGAPLVLNTTDYTNAAGNSYKVTLLEYVLTHFRLSPTVDGDPGDYDSAVVHYANPEDDATLTAGFTDVPAGVYNELSFTFGIPAAENTSGAFPALDQLGMAWPAQMGGGYHYMRNEGKFVDSMTMTVGFTTHVGPTMGVDYSFPVTISVPEFTVDNGNTTTIRVKLDINQWYETPTTYDFNDYGAIMGNPGAQALLQANGASVFSLGGVN